jgi:hypothetical protein
MNSVRSAKFKCEICTGRYSGSSNYHNHMMSQQHQKALAELPPGAEIPKYTTPLEPQHLNIKRKQTAEITVCELCKGRYRKYTKKVHEKTGMHTHALEMLGG